MAKFKVGDKVKAARGGVDSGVIVKVLPSGRFNSLGQAYRVKWDHNGEENQYEDDLVAANTALNIAVGQKCTLKRPGKPPIIGTFVSHNEDADEVVIRTAKGNERFHMGFFDMVVPNTTVTNAAYSKTLEEIMSSVKPYLDKRFKGDQCWKWPMLVLTILRKVCDKAVMSAGKYDGKRPPHRVYDVECVKDGMRFTGNLICCALLARPAPDDVSAFDEYDMIMSLFYAGKAMNSVCNAKDQNGREIHIGDKVEWLDNGFHTGTVTLVDYNRIVVDRRWNVDAMDISVKNSLSTNPVVNRAIAMNAVANASFRVGQKVKAFDDPGIVYTVVSPFLEGGHAILCKGPNGEEKRFLSHQITTANAVVNEKVTILKHNGKWWARIGGSLYGGCDSVDAACKVAERKGYKDWVVQHDGFNSTLPVSTNAVVRNAVARNAAAVCNTLYDVVTGLYAGIKKHDTKFALEMFNVVKRDLDANTCKKIEESINEGMYEIPKEVKKAVFEADAKRGHFYSAQGKIYKDHKKTLAVNAKFKVGDKVKYIGKRYGISPQTVCQVHELPTALGQYTIQSDDGKYAYLVFEDELAKI